MKWMRIPWLTQLNKAQFDKTQVYKNLGQHGATRHGKQKVAIKRNWNIDIPTEVGINQGERGYPIISIGLWLEYFVSVQTGGSDGELNKSSNAENKSILELEDGNGQSLWNFTDQVQ